LRKFPRYIYERKYRDGGPRLFFWRGKGHAWVRFDFVPGTPEFHEAYAAVLRNDALPGSENIAAATRIKAKSGSVRWLFEQYMASSAFTALGDSTRHVRRQILEHIMLEPTKEGSNTVVGDVAWQALTSKAIRVLRDRKRDTPAAANSRVIAIRRVFDQAIEEAEELGIIVNPATSVKLFGGSSEGFHTWTLQEVEQFEARHAPGTKARLALALLLFTGVRRSDVVRLGRQMIRDGKFHFQEVKGRAKKVKNRSLPILPVLQQVIDATPVTNMTFLVSERGRAFSAASFGNWFRKRCNEAGLSQCSAHGCRKAGATIAANNGATDRQLMAIFGWETVKQVSTYTKDADRIRLADEAMHLLVPARTVKQ
jgi:integrase